LRASVKSAHAVLAVLGTISVTSISGCREGCVVPFSSRGHFINGYEYFPRLPSLSQVGDTISRPAYSSGDISFEFFGTGNTSSASSLCLRSGEDIGAGSWYNEGLNRPVSI
jgi:hypothetical protein